MQNNYFMLGQCSASYSRSGRWIYLVCLATWEVNVNTLDKVILLHVIDARSLEVVQSRQENLDLDRFYMYLLPPVPSCNDDSVSVWALNLQNNKVSLDLEVSVPRALLRLQELSRNVVNSYCACRNLDKLPLPAKMLRYLRFEWGY